MRVFITGGAGFIGSHLADHYVNAGDQVTLLDNFSTGSKANIAHLADKVSTIDGDIRNVELIDQLTGNSYQSQSGISLNPYQVLWLMAKN